MSHQRRNTIWNVIFHNSIYFSVKLINLSNCFIVCNKNDGDREVCVEFSIIGGYQRYSASYFISYRRLFCVLLNKYDCNLKEINILQREMNEVTALFKLPEIDVCFSDCDESDFYSDSDSE